MNLEEDVRQVQEALGRLILGQLQGVVRQQYFPNTDPDNMDKRIDEGKKRAQELRSIREQFENLVTGVIL